jgi:RNA polymerase sigma-70 factor (ECF subfamily)
MSGRVQLYVVQGEDPASDDDLMRLARDGRRDAFEVLVSRHTALVIGTATRFLGDRQKGREVAQDVFLMLWAERDRYVPQDKLRNLLVTMTFNRCRAVARTMKSDTSKTERLAASGEVAQANTPLDELIERSKAAEVRRALTKLPEPVREILILRYTHELSLEEIAEATEKPVGTIKSHVFRGLKKLRETLSKGGEE